MLLRFLIHLVGDIHQPLHTVVLYTKQFPQGDMGGNKFYVLFPNTTVTTLHMAWDSGMFLFSIHSSYSYFEALGLYSNDPPRPLSTADAMSLYHEALEITTKYPEV
jgi:hypothetical protein